MLRCALVCTYKTFTKGRSIFSRSTENGPAFPYNLLSRSLEKEGWHFSFPKDPYGRDSLSCIWSGPPSIFSAAMARYTWNRRRRCRREGQTNAVCVRGRAAECIPQTVMHMDKQPAAASSSQQQPAAASSSRSPAAYTAAAASSGPQPAARSPQTWETLYSPPLCAAMSWVEFPEASAAATMSSTTVNPEPFQNPIGSALRPDQRDEQPCLLCRHAISLVALRPEPDRQHPHVLPAQRAPPPPRVGSAGSTEHVFPETRDSGLRGCEWARAMSERTQRPLHPSLFSSRVPGSETPIG